MDDAPMQLVTRMLADASRLPPGQQIILAAERRLFLKRRWRATASDGTDFGFDLEERLCDGAVIWQHDGFDYVVRQVPEIVYRIALDNPGQAALVAWKTGNLHLPAQITGDAMLVLHDPAMAQLLEREGWSFSEPVVVFRPMKAIAHTP